MPGHRVERRPDLVCERRRDLADGGHAFGVREALLRAHQVAVGRAQFRGSVIDSYYQLAVQAADLFQQLFALARSRRDLVHHLIETRGNFTELVVAIDGRARGEIAVSSIVHRLHDVFHGFAEKIYEDEIDQGD